MRRRRSETSSLTTFPRNRLRSQRLNRRLCRHRRRPVLLASISPANAYARAPEFKLEAAGDKFTPALRIYVDGRELPTKYISPNNSPRPVPASFIANPGPRPVIVRTADNSLYSNVVSLGVAPAPTPNYTYVGIIGKPTYVGDVALVQDKATRVSSTCSAAIYLAVASA
jgi:hypothetical protein